MKWVLSVLAILFSAESGAAELYCRIDPVRHAGITIELCDAVGPERAKADILYLPSLVNEPGIEAKTLIDDWVAAGYRVVTFKYPRGLSAGDILDALPTIVARTKPGYGHGGPRPYFLSGWSKGGLLAIRAIQTHPELERELSGLILFAPAIDMLATTTGRGWAVIATSPTPLASAWFLMSQRPLAKHTTEADKVPPSAGAGDMMGLLAEGARAELSSHVISIPTQIFIAEKDVHVESGDIIQFADWQRARNPRVEYWVVDGAYHQVFEESHKSQGRKVRAKTIEFLNQYSR